MVCIISFPVISCISFIKSFALPYLVFMLYTVFDIIGMTVASFLIKSFILGIVVRSIGNAPVKTKPILSPFSSKI